MIPLILSSFLLLRLWRRRCDCIDLVFGFYFFFFSQITALGIRHRLPLDVTRVIQGYLRVSRVEKLCLHLLWLLRCGYEDEVEWLKLNQKALLM